MLNLDYYFPTPIWWADINIDREGLMKQIYDMRDTDPRGREISNRGGWQSQEINGNDVAELRDTIFPLLDKTTSDYGFDTKGKAFTFGNAWANINKRGDTNMAHIHHGAYLSGVYFVSAPENCGDLIFYRDFNEQFIIESNAPIKEYTPLSGGMVKHTPKTGRLVIFPANLVHSVEAGDCDEDRISVAFNIGLVNI